MTDTNHRKVKTWDLPTRLWHWTLVGLIVFLWYSAEVADDLVKWHMLAGRTVLALLVFRIIWGLVGSDTARFSHFLRSPRLALAELKGLMNGNMKRHIGHNPAGGWSVVLLLLLLAMQVGAGLFVSDGYLWEGPFAHMVSSGTQDFMMEVHEIGFNLILAAVAMHILAIVIHSLRGDHLVGAMVTGHKKLPATTSALPPSQWRSPWLGLLLFAVSGGVVFFITQ